MTRLKLWQCNTVKNYRAHLFAIANCCVFFLDEKSAHFFHFEYCAVKIPHPTLYFNCVHTIHSRGWICIEDLHCDDAENGYRLQRNRINSYKMLKNENILYKNCELPFKFCTLQITSAECDSKRLNSRKFFQLFERNFPKQFSLSNMSWKP